MYLLRPTYLVYIIFLGRNLSNFSVVFWKIYGFIKYILTLSDLQPHLKICNTLSEPIRGSSNYSQDPTANCEFLVGQNKVFKRWNKPASNKHTTYWQQLLNPSLGFFLRPKQMVVGCEQKSRSMMDVLSYKYFVLPLFPFCPVLYTIKPLFALHSRFNLSGSLF